jgi:hypothetical protein
VNCIAPGAIWRLGKDGKPRMSPFIQESIPLHRTGTTRDIGEAAAFLAGGKAAYITGVTLLVDGGLSLPGLWEQPEAIPWKSPLWNPKQREKAMEMLKRSHESSELKEKK